MRVLHLISPGAIAGAERVVLGGCEALAAAGAEVQLVGLSETRASDAQADFFDQCGELSVETPRISVTSRIDPHAIGALDKRLHRFAPQVVHVHGHKALFMAKLVGIGRTWGVVATNHGRTAHDNLARIYGRLEDAMYRFVDRVIEVDPLTEAAPNAVHIPNFLSLEQVPTRRRRLHQPARAVFVGRLSPEKNLAALVGAIAKVARPVELTVVGDGPEREELEAQVSLLGMGDRVEFVGFQSDITPFLTAADFAVMPSLREGFPMAAIEALAAGLPMLASRVGGLPSMIEDGKTGVLVEIERSEALATGLERLLEAHDTLSRHAFERADRLREQLSSERWARRHLDLYRSIWTTVGA